MKLFGKGGKLNIIDILIIVILLAALVFVGIKLFAKDTETLGSETALSTPNLRATVLCEEIDPELAANMVAAIEGAPETIEGNTVEQTRLFYSNKLADGKLVEWKIVEKGDKVNLYLTFEAAATISGGAYSVGMQEILISKDFIVKTLSVEIEGVVLSMEKLG